MSTIKAINIIHPSSASANIVLNADGSIETPAIAGGIPSGSTMLFYQAAAPTGWTKVTTQNDKALRVVSGTGGGTGGSVAFSTVFTSVTPSGTVGNTTLTLSQIPSHAHGGVITDTQSNSGGTPGALAGAGTAYSTVYQTGSTNSQGGSTAHNHSFTGNSINFSVQYIDLIIASKN